MYKLLIISVFVWLVNIASLFFVQSIYNWKIGDYRIPHISIVIIISALCIIYITLYGRSELVGQYISASGMSVSTLLMVLVFYLPLFNVIGYVVNGFHQDEGLTFKYIQFGVLLYYAFHITWVVYKWLLPNILKE